MTALADLRIATPPGPDLRERLHRLKRPLPTRSRSERMLPGATGACRLLALLAELDETILPRDLTLCPTDGPPVVLSVLRRRLVEFHDRTSASPTAPDLSMADIADKLQAFLDQHARVRIQSRRADPGDRVAENGFSADQLAECLGLERRQQPTREGASAFNRALDRHALAWVRLSQAGSVAASGGAPDQVRILSDLGRGMASELEGMLDAAHGQDGLSGYLLIGDGAQGDGLLIAREHDRITLARIALRDQPDLGDALSALFGSG